MTANDNTHGMIAVDKMGTKVLFLDPETFETEVVIGGFQKTVYELLIVPETALAYVPIFGDEYLTLMSQETPPSQMC